MKKQLFAHISLFFANTIYALNYIFAKDVMPEYISPTAFILLRVLGASIVFNFLHFFYINERLAKNDVFHIIICSLFGVVINMLCFFKGLSLTTPINASLIMITTPLIVYTISCFLTKHEFRYSRFFGVVLGFFGGWVLITNGQLRFNTNLVGDILVFINACSYGVYLILIKSLMCKYHPITVLKNLFSIGLVFLLPLGWSDFQQVEFINMPLEIMFKMGFVVIFTTCVAYFLNIYAVSRLKAYTVAFYIYLQPLLATIFSIILGKDVVTVIKLISAILICCGVYFVLQRSST